MWTKKDLLKHQNQMLESSTQSNPYTQMDYEIKKYKYQRWRIIEGVKCIGIGIVIWGVIYYLLF